MVDKLLTDAERHAVELTAGVWNYMVQNVVGLGPSRSGDLAELRFYIHGIQRMVMSQAAARAYPDEFRLLGSTIQAPRVMESMGVVPPLQPALCFNPECPKAGDCGAECVNNF